MLLLASSVSLFLVPQFRQRVFSEFISYLSQGMGGMLAIGLGVQGGGFAHKEEEDAGVHEGLQQRADGHEDGVEADEEPLVLHDGVFPAAVVLDG
jgi:hypothetical protein